MRDRPLQALNTGHWFKLICGASYQHLPAIRNLCLVYTAAGADCLDVAPDPAVIAAAQAGRRAATVLRSASSLPWLMVSLNAGEDPHFRKAILDPARCPPDCPQPCVAICPAQAIAFPHTTNRAGVEPSRCYGCGRCLPLCPIEQIETKAHPASPQTILPLIAAGEIDALEIHTQVGQIDAFKRLWQQIAVGIPHLKILAISCPDGESLLTYLSALYQVISPLPCPLIWQVDGRPMSGDIGNGTTAATIKVGLKVLQSQLPGFVQLAGGTNGHTVAKLKALGLLHPSRSSHPPDRDVPERGDIAGVAYGSFARRLLDPVLMTLEQQASRPVALEDSPHLFAQALELAQGLVHQLKPQPPQLEVD